MFMFGVVAPDSIKVPDRTQLSPGQRRQALRDAKRAAAHQRSVEAAERRIRRGRELAIPHAKAKLRKLSARDAAEFVEDLPHREKYIYARAEAEDQARTTVLKKLRGYVPEDAQPVG